MGYAEGSKKAQENQGERQPHHLEIMQAIEAMATVRGDLQSLLVEIRGPEERKDPGEPVTGHTPPLSWVLDNAADLIRAQAKQGLSLIQEIRGVLF